ncbi:MAG TPA: restriction endonuclease subunit S, partial [Eubacteriaceae bacterium]|nr:restriction endonuclease subunit S [Eubacteriaceae bacterium]
MSFSEWREVKLEDIIEIIGGGTPKTSIPEYWSGSIPWISVKDFNTGYRYVYETEKTITEIGLNNSSTKLLNKDDLIISARGTVGALAQLGRPMAFNQSCYGLRAKEMTTNDFVYYLLKNMIGNIQQNTHGSVFNTITRDTFGILKANLPPLEEQKAIARILSTLDDKIEVNNEINKTLENMAQEIFKQWFVEFDFPNEDGEPYKSSGGEMVESEMGMIPKGWEVSTLKDVINIIDNRGKTPPQEPSKTIYPIIDVKALSGDIRVIDYNNCMKYVSKETYDNWFRSGHPSQGDILLSTVGSLAELKIFMGNTGCIAQNVVALRTKTISNLYLYELLKNIKNDLVSYNIGSVQPSIKVTHIVKHKILIPNNIIVEKFHLFMDEITNEIFIKHNENVLLTSIRDSLIPKLMS